MQILKIGVLGTAGIANKFVIPTLAQLSDKFEIVGVGGRTFNTTEAFCASHSIRPYVSYQEMLDAEIDLVYIPLPNGLHFEWVKKALDMGIHVVCEKSLGCTFNEVEQMVDKARKKNLLLIEHFQFRFHKQMSVITEQMKKIGELRSIRSNFGIPPFADKENIRYQKQIGGGALLDNGAYLIKLAQILLGNDLQVDACSLNKGNFEVDIWGNLSLINKKSNVVFSGTFGFDHVYRNDLEIIGSKGRIFTDRIYTCPPNFKPTISLEVQEGYSIKKQDFVLEEDNHFMNIWTYVYNSIVEGKHFEFENEQNLSQAKLISDALTISNGK